MIVLLAACGPPTPPALPPTPELLTGPTVEHTPPDQPLVDGDVITLVATASDEDGLAGMEVRYRPVGELFYERLEMAPVAAPEEDATSVGYTIDLTVTAPGVEYVLRAFDASEWRIPGTFPLDAEQDPQRLDVGGFTPLAPYAQDFDEVTDFGLYDLGWTETSMAFRGRRWRQSISGGLDSPGARHDPGYPGMQPVDDWLVAPTLDFSALTTAEARWLERGVGVDTANHSLWLSTGDPDPENDAFIKVVGLQAPEEGVWRPAPVVNLTEWAGEPRVTLAWRYEGEGESDEWRIDDVRIGEYRPDISLRDSTVGRIDPGDRAPVALRFVNLGAPTTDSVVASATVLSGQASFDGPIDLGPLDTQEASEPVFELTVASEQPDNTVIQAQIAADDGQLTRTWPLPILVGDPTVGLVRLQVAQPGLVQVRMGVGEPGAAFVEEPVFQGQLSPGVYTFAADLGEHIDWLPAAPGRGAWWTSVESEGLAQLLGFGIDFDGSVTWSEATGQVSPGQTRRFHLPARAEPVIIGLSSDPMPLAPGSTGQLWLTLDNRGGPTDGPTALRVSGDPRLGLGTDEVVLPNDWDGQATVAIPVSVDPAHTDATPLDLELIVVDRVDAFPVSTQVEVPWPVLGFGQPLVTDPTGNSDGVLDPEELVAVLLSVRNDGTLSTGTLTCTVTQTAGPTAVVTPSVELQPIAPGTSRALNLILTATGAVDGDALDFEVTCIDGAGSWTGPLQLAVGGAPWVPIGSDAADDDLAGASLDIRDVRARVNGAFIELEINGAAPIDAASLDLEVWTDSPGGSWRNMVVTIVNGQATLWGTQSGGWNPLADPELTVQGSSVRIGLPIPELGLAENTLQLGIGTGFCAIPELYCDRWPEDWGNPYDLAPNADDLAQFGW